MKWPLRRGGQFGRRCFQEKVHLTRNPPPFPFLEPPNSFPWTPASCNLREIQGALSEGKQVCCLTWAGSPSRLAVSQVQGVLTENDAPRARRLGPGGGGGPLSRGEASRKTHPLLSSQLSSQAKMRIVPIAAGPLTKWT